MKENEKRFKCRKFPQNKFFLQKEEAFQVWHISHLLNIIQDEFFSIIINLNFIPRLVSSTLQDYGFRELFTLVSLVMPQWI